MAKDYSNVLRKDVPVEETWKVDDIFASINEWEKEKDFVLTSLDKIDELKKTWTSNAQNFFELLDFVNTLQMKAINVYIYTSLLYDTNMEDSNSQSLKGQADNLFVQLGTKTSFIQSDILALGEDRIKEYFAQEKKLEDYDVLIKKILDKKEHILSSEMEELFSLTSLFADSSRKASSLLSNLELPVPTVTLSNGQEVDLTTANFNLIRGSKVREDRELVMREFFDNRYKFRNTFAALLDGGIKTHLFNAKARGYKDCLEAALKPNNIDREVYLNLIKTVKENLKPLHNYLEIKRDFLALDKLTYSDIYASSISSVDKEYSIEEGIKLVIDSMEILGNEYTDALKEGFENRWMDIYPNKGKRSGAYSNGACYDKHPFVLMNYDGRYSNVSTLTHEFGHALHSYFSNKNNHASKARYPIFLAEIASTFNENLLIDFILQKEDDKEFKKYILDQHIEGLRGTLYRQTLFAEFELLIHQEVEAGRSLTADFLDETYLRLTREYYGHDLGIMEVPEYIKSEWSYIPHFYMNFYVYQYSTGVIASMALVELVQQKGEEAKEKYMTFLKSGGNDYPLNILNRAGVDLRQVEVIQKGLDRFSAVVDELKNLK